MGLGYCADGESVGKELMGRDGKAWVVGVKNSNKMWMRAPDSLKREEPVLAAEPEPKIDATVVSEDEDIELPALEEIPNEEVEIEDPFGWKPETEVVEEEVKPALAPVEETSDEDETKVVVEEVKPEPKKKAAGRPKKVVVSGDEEEVKPKKAGRPKKVVVSGDEAEVKPEPKKAGRPKKVVVSGDEADAEPKKAGRPKKVVAVDEAEGEVKPKRKYTRKVKPDADEAPVKERKPRAKTEYNEFIGKAMKEMREKNKELKTTDYMKLAIEEWKTYKASKLVATA